MENEYVSSNLVNRYAIGFVLILAAIAIYFDKSAVAVLLIFIAIFAVVSRLWGSTSLQKVSVSVEGSYSRIFTGQRFQATYHIRNDKAIPMVWLELMHDIPAREVAKPTLGFLKKCIRNLETDQLEDKYSVKFSWLMPYSELNWSTEYEALRRGVYRLNRLIAFSGDGFGLTINREDFNLGSDTGFVIYPEVYPVGDGFFRKSLSENAAGSNGIYEDRTLLSSIKDYDGRDSFKKINWRMYARGGSLSANIYKTIQPSSCMFILDTASFKWNEEAFEYMVSLIASAVCYLEGSMQIGFMAPATGLNKSVFILPSEEGSTDYILTALSSVEADFSEEIKFDTASAYENAETFGQLYFCYCSTLSPIAKKLALRLKSSATYFIYTDSEVTASDNSYFAGDICHFTKPVPAYVEEKQEDDE